MGPSLESKQLHHSKAVQCVMMHRVCRRLSAANVVGYYPAPGRSLFLCLTNTPGGTSFIRYANIIGPVRIRGKHNRCVHEYAVALCTGPDQVEACRGGEHFPGFGELLPLFCQPLYTSVEPHLRLLVGTQSGEKVTKLDDLQDIDELHVIEVGLDPALVLLL